MKPLGKQYSDAEARGDGGFERLPAGGYVCKITDVEDVTAKDYLALTFDIAEGDRKGFYSNEWGLSHPYAHRFILSYKESALGMFKGRLKAIDESNGTEFVKEAVAGLKEQQLVGKLVGLVIGYEEYASDRGDTRTRSYVKAVISADRVRRGDFKIPELKRLEGAAAPAITEHAGEAPAGFSWGDDVPF